MIDEILQKAGFEKGVTYAQAVFKFPPTKPFVVYFDDFDTSPGSDLCADLTEHNVTFELYVPAKEAPQLEKAIEAQLKTHNIQFQKTGRTWIQSERYFLTVYEFSYFEKE